jgi:hypothetical protein
VNKFSFGGGLEGSLTGKVATQWPLFGKGYPIHFWADKGLVRWEDEREGLPPSRKRGFIYWQDAAKRVLALSEMVIKSSEDRRWARERQILQQFISEMEDVIRLAKEQGGPLDGDSVRREYKRRRPTTVVKPTIVELD